MTETTTETPVAPVTPDTPVPGGVGDSPVRPDGILKVKGEFAYSSDMSTDDTLWGATLRSPHAHARIRSIDIGRAVARPGVYAVLTHEDVPGRPLYGLEVPDQRVLAFDEVRYHGEPVVIVAADHPETARLALRDITVDYEPLAPLVDARLARDRDSPQVHPKGNVVKHVRIRKGDVSSVATAAAVVVTGDYEVGMQDQAFLGLESGLAVPADDGGIDLYVATQWLHVDRSQLSACLGLAEEKVRIHLAGVGGAFGAREDLSIQVHASMLAMRTGRPVRMVYSREESFFGHVHRHPAFLHYEHGADAEGRLLYVRAEIVLDGGAYASSSQAVAVNAATLGIGPYEVANVEMDSLAVYTHNPPCGAMRGFGAVQVCFAYEAQMDEVAARLDLDPVEVRIRNALAEGSTMPTGQVVDSPAPVAELLTRVRDKPRPLEGVVGDVDLRDLPGGVANTTHGEGVVRGVGYGIGIKNVCFSAGFDDPLTARVRVELVAGAPVVSVHTAAAEVGQGVVTVQAQVARTELGADHVVVLPADTSIGNAGSTSASRQTYMNAGGVQAACQEVRDKILALVPRREPSELRLAGGNVVDAGGGVVVSLAELLSENEPIEATVDWRHRPTEPLDEQTGQGRAHVQYAVAAHRAVVDVDIELGLVKVVELAAAQDVGKAINPQAVLGQIHGGSAQGLGLAVMEEIQLEDGLVRNPSFTDYLIPTILDVPPMRVDVLEMGDPYAPYGLRGVGEPPTISATPAIVAAIRNATGLPLRRVPVRPEHITGT